MTGKVVTMRRLALLVFGTMAMCPASVALAQNTLGELLDAGAKVVTTDEFKQEVVQRLLVGPTPTGGRVEVMYTAGGEIQGRGTVSPLATPLYAGAGGMITGRWTVDPQQRICTSLSIHSVPGIGMGAGFLPPRCQYWFRSGGTYFLSDSDWDRSAKVLVMIVKP